MDWGTYPAGPGVPRGSTASFSTVVGVISPALILAGILKFPAVETGNFVSMALLAAAFGVLPFAFIYVISILEALGDITATAQQFPPAGLPRSS